MKRGAQILNLDKNWWKEERQPTQENQIVLKNVRRTKVTYPLLTVKQVATRLNVGIWSVYDYIASGELGSQAVGKRKRISEEALEDFLILQNLKHSRN